MVIATNARNDDQYVESFIKMLPNSKESLVRIYTPLFTVVSYYWLLLELFVYFSSSTYDFVSSSTTLCRIHDVATKG